MDRQEMSRYWDARAREDAFYFVDSRLRYRNPDLERFWAGGREDLDHILGALGVRLEPEHEIVEIGCGVGRITRVLAERGRSVRALDVSKQMLEEARRHNEHLHNVEWILGDGQSLAPLASGSADVCFSHVVFQHIPDPRITLAYVRETGRVLRPSGWAAFQMSNAPELHRPRPLAGRLRALPRLLFGRVPRGQAHRAWLGSAVDIEELRRVAREASMDVERIEGTGSQWCVVLLRRYAGQGEAGPTG